MQIFDRAILRQRKQRAASKIKEHDFLLQETARQLNDRILDFNRDFELALSISTLPELIIKNKKIGRTVNASPLVKTPGSQIVFDEEFLPFADQSFDAVISNFHLHTVNDLPGALLQIRRILKPDGVFLAAMPGGETLKELRDAMMMAEMDVYGGASPRVAPFADIKDMGSLLQRAGFTLPVTDSDLITVSYPNAFKLIHDLRAMGETNVTLNRNKRPLSRKMMMAMAQAYQEHFAENDGTIPARFQMIYMTGWAPHETQQQPLRPGSAENRLSDTLGTQELSTGEKARP